MLRRIVLSSATALLLSVPVTFSNPSDAFACGDETGSSCGSDEDDARYMLDAAVKAVQADEASALTWFTEQSHAFRTEDVSTHGVA